MADGKSKALLTPMFRVSFPSVFEKSSFEGGEGRYSVVGLFQPAQFTEADKAKWTAIRTAMDEVCKAEFKKTVKEMQASGVAFRFPIRKGEEKPHLEGYGPGVVFFTMASTKRRPSVVDKNGVSITAENSEEFYAGCYARASVIPFAFNNKFGKGVSIGLGNLQKLGDGESFSGFTSAEEDFGGDAAEFDTSKEEVEDFAS